MAGIEGDLTIWVLLHDAVLLVERYTKSNLEAQWLILEYANKRHFTECRFSGGQFIDPQFWNAHHPRFGLYIPVDFRNSTVTRLRAEPTEYLLPEMLVEKLKELPAPAARRERHARRSMPPEARLAARAEMLVEKFKELPTPEARLAARAAARAWPKPAWAGLCPPRSLQMHLVCLAHHELVSMLYKAGLLELSDPPPAPPMPEPRGVPEPTSEKEERPRPEPASKRTGKETPEWPSAEMLGLGPRAWQQRRIWTEMPEIYRRHPERFDSNRMWNRKASDLLISVQNLRDDKARAEGKASKAVSPDSCEDLLKAWKAWQTRHRASS